MLYCLILLLQRKEQKTTGLVSIVFFSFCSMLTGLQMLVFTTITRCLKKNNLLVTDGYLTSECLACIYVGMCVYQILYRTYFQFLVFLKQNIYYVNAAIFNGLENTMKIIIDWSQVLLVFFWSLVAKPAALVLAP